MARIETRPDERPFVEHRLQRIVQLVVNDGVRDRAARTIPAADVDRQESLVQPIRFGPRGFASRIDRLLRAVSGHVHEKVIAGACARREFAQCLKNVLARRQNCTSHCITDKRDVARLKTTTQQGVVQQSHVIARSRQNLRAAGGGVVRYPY